MANINFYNTPRLPRALLHVLTVSTITYERKAGEAPKPVEEATRSFMGVVMPLTNKDLKLLPEGSYTANTQKLYTDDPINIKPGQTITDTYDGQKYTVKKILNHNSIHPMNRYIVEGVEK